VTRSGLVFDDRYRLEERIAAGGVGQVWRASDLLLGRPVAVKVLRPEYADHRETLDRFRMEARLAGALSHPGIAQVYDYGDWSAAGPPFLVLELVDGPSLAALLAEGPVDPELALDVIAQAAEGLHAAHRAGLVHRDVKPGNILIGPDGQVKITDFGIAHAAGQAPLTGPGLVMGTSHYMAPERITGSAGGPASDLYALGIVLHECLAGVHPYGGSAAEALAAHLYLPLPGLPADVPAAIAEFVAQLTAKDPGRRLADAREVAARAAALRDALRPADVPAQPADAPAQPADAPAQPAAWPSQPGEAEQRGERTPVIVRRPPSSARLRVGMLVVAATLLAGAGLAGLFASGVLRSSQATGIGHGSPASGGTAAAGQAPSTSRGTSTSGRQPGGQDWTGNGGTPASSGTPTGGADTSPTASGSTTTSAAPSASPTGTPVSSPSPTPSVTPDPAPSPTPSGTGPSLPIPLPSVTLSL
jgi:serine/threonine-protein kinase